MRNFIYIVYFTIFILLKNCSPECTHYYLVLNENYETDMTNERIEPTSMKAITLDQNSFNNTKELHDNEDCILEFINTPSCPLNSTTLCHKHVPERECTHYYLVLNEYFETDLTQERIEPTSMKIISTDHPSFNNSENFKTLHDNKDCILEFKITPDCPLNSTTLCHTQVPERECTHYYLMLNEYIERDLLKEHIEPTTVKTIALDHPSFNSTEVFKELQYNEGCILEFKNTPSCPLNSTTLCLKQVPDRAEIYYTTYETTTARVYNSTNGNAALVARNDTLRNEKYTTFNNTIDYTTSTVKAETNNSTNGDALLVATNDNLKNEKYTTFNHSSNYETSTVNTETHNYTNENAALTNGKAANDAKEIAKTVGIVAAGATGAAALGYFITMKIKHMLQYGAYHLP